MRRFLFFKEKSMEPIQRVEIVKIAKTNVWIEDDIFGSRHVVVQHEGCDPFTECAGSPGVQPGVESADGAAVLRGGCA